MIVSTNEKSVRITSAKRYKIFVSSDKVCVESGTGSSDHDGPCTAARANQQDKQLFSLQNWIHDPT